MRIAIFDDDSEKLLSHKKTINNLFEQYTSDFETICFCSGNELLDEHRKSEFDVVFLEINMPQKTAFEVAKEIRSNSLKCCIVFVSSHSQLVYDCFEFMPFDFIRKDADESLTERLACTVNRLMLNFKQKKTLELIGDDLRKVSVPISKIVYLSSDGHYVDYYVAGKAVPYRMRRTIKDCESELAPFDFLRIHKSYIVNLRYMEGVDFRDNEILINGIPKIKRLPISRTLKREADNRFRAYLNNR